MCYCWQGALGNSLSPLTFPWVTNDFTRAALDWSSLDPEGHCLPDCPSSTTGILDCSCSPQEGVRGALPPASPSLQGLTQTSALPSSAMEIITEADEDAHQDQHGLNIMNIMAQQEWALLGPFRIGTLTSYQYHQQGSG